MDFEKSKGGEIPTIVKETNEAQTRSRFYNLAAEHNKLMDELKELQESAGNESLIEGKKNKIAEITNEICEASGRLGRIYESGDESVE